MSVWSKKIGGLMVASIVAAAVAGCGGGDGSLPNNPSNNVVEVDGGVDTRAGIVDISVPASETGELIEVTIDGQTVTAATPADTAVTAGQEVAVIPANTTLLNGLTGGARGPGDIYINGKKIKSKVSNGKISPAIALPAGNYTLRAEGPFDVKQGANQLTVGEFVFNFSSNGRQLSLPVSLTGRIPANGSNNWTNSVTAGFSSNYDDGTATLRITHLNGVLQRTSNVNNGQATFTDFANDQQSQIPAQGVQTVEFTHN